MKSVRICSGPRAAGSHLWIGQVNRHHQFSLAIDRVVRNHQHVLTVQGNGAFVGTSGVSGQNSFEFHRFRLSALD